MIRVVATLLRHKPKDAGRVTDMIKLISSHEFPGSFSQKCERIAAPLVIGHLPHRLPVRCLLADSSCPSSQEALCSLRAYPQSHYPGSIHFILGSFCCSAMLPGGQVFIFLFSIPPAHLSFSLQPYGRCGDGVGIGGTKYVCAVCVWLERKKHFPLPAKILSVALPPFPFIAVSVKRRKKKSHEPNRLISQNTPEKYACCACNYLWEQGVFIIYIYIYIYLYKYIYIHI